MADRANNFAGISVAFCTIAQVMNLEYGAKKKLVARLEKGEKPNVVIADAVELGMKIATDVFDDLVAEGKRVKDNPVGRRPEEDHEVV